MKRYLANASMVLAFTLVAAACGGDDDDDSNQNTAGTGGGGNQNVACEPSDDGACTNEGDCPKVRSGEARMASQSCGLGCQQDDNPGMCAVSCIVQETQISQGCAVCYATLVGCASENCLAACAADPTSAACNQCQVDAGCRADFDSCSGLTTAN